ncbi:MAG: asparagine synthase-related protein [Nitrososphaerales archaeon]
MFINGLICFYNVENLSKKIKLATESLKHRAKRGFICCKDFQFEPLSSFNFDTNQALILSLWEDFSKDELASYIGRDFCKLNLKALIDDSLSSSNLEEFSLKLKGVRAHYSFAYADDRGLIFGRDNLGVKPLYFSKRGKEITIATERKVLESLGYNEINHVKPNTLYLTNNGSSFLLREIETFEENKFKGNFEEAKEELKKNLNSCVKNFSYENLTLGFSGGIDSLLLAKIFSEHQSLTLSSLCFKGSEEESWIDRASEKLNLEIKKYYLNEDLVKENLPLVKGLVEKSKPMDLAIGLGFYLLSKFSSREGLDKIVLGQLADEMFGGYRRYLVSYLKGFDVKTSMLKDVLDSHETTFSREDKACSPFSLVVFPYANFDIFKFAFSLPLEFKFDKEKKVRKLLLRELAKEIGIESSLVEREKKAFQYSTKLENMVKRFLANIA